MGLHKLTAGDGYTYLTRQVAAHDATERGTTGLGDYYSEKGESPGRWWGSGCAAFDTDSAGEGAGSRAFVGSVVAERQMLNLFGEGRHPDADRLEMAVIDAGGTTRAAMRASQLGALFAVHGAPSFHCELARRYGEHNASQGRAWNTPVPDEVRARIRTALADELFVVEHGRAPLGDRERAGFLARVSRQKTDAVAGYDLTFTPVKSVSTLWALADPTTALEVEAAHDAAVERTLAYLEREVLFTRRGRNGVQQVATRGMIAALFTHRDSRAGDPNLHTHVAISNKVQDQTGRWLAIDGRVLHKATVALSESYNTFLEAELVSRLGVRFADRGTHRGTHRSPTRSPTGEPSAAIDAAIGRGRRQVREVVGVDPRLAEAWSSRSAAIETRRRELASGFQKAQGRPPTAVESLALAQQATLETRQAKHAPRSEAEQRTTWRAEAETVLGSSGAVEAMLGHALNRQCDWPPHQPAVLTISTDLVQRIAANVVERVAADRSTWQVWHLRAEAMRQIRSHDLTASPRMGGDGTGVADLEVVRDLIVDAALEQHSVAIGGVPDRPPTVDRARPVDARPDIETTVAEHTPLALKRPDGASVYSVHGSQLFTSRAVLDAERVVLDAASRTDGTRVSDVRVEIALAESTANGVTLNASQASLVRELATSGRRIQLALAPAGTGKTTAISVLARAWTTTTPPPRTPTGLPDQPSTTESTVIGLAPSAAAAQQLAEAIGSAGISDTLAKLVHHIRPDADQTARAAAPEWVRGIGPETLIVIDEAGMAPTGDLAVVTEFALERGASIRLVGDDRQLAAVEASGILRDIATTEATGGAVTLTEVMRFHDPAEAAATLAVRDGDPTSVGFYADHDRLHVGDTGHTLDHTFNAWATDTAAGRASVMLAPTRDLVAELNTRARTHRLQALQTGQRNGTTGPADPGGPMVELDDGTEASVADTVITRRNDRALRVTASDWVKNGDRWTITRVHADGRLSLAHGQHGRAVTLPAAYVREHVQLGYATTIHGAQGLTVDTSHTVLTGAEDRNLLYVALTRGRSSNHVYLATGTDGDPHTALHPDTLRPPTPVEQLTAILGRDGSARSAKSELAVANDPAALLHAAAGRYEDAVHYAAERVLGDTTLAELDDLAARHGLDQAPAWPTLRSHLALAALDTPHDEDAGETLGSPSRPRFRLSSAYLTPAELARRTAIRSHRAAELLQQLLRAAPLGDARDPAAVLDHRLATLHDSQPAGHARGSDAPLAWLPRIPDALADDSDWGPYLTAAGDAVREHATTVANATRAWTPSRPGDLPAWARLLLTTNNTATGTSTEAAAGLVVDLAVWRAARGVPAEDTQPAGPAAYGRLGEHRNNLRRRAAAITSTYQYTRRGWYQSLPAAVRDDAWAPVLCQRLAQLERGGLDPAALVAEAVTTRSPSPGDTNPGNTDPSGTGVGVTGTPRPLPSETPAAALWWRLARHLGPAVVTDPHAGDLLHPTWTGDLDNALPRSHAQAVRRSPAWPALVAAIDEATTPTRHPHRTDQNDQTSGTWTPAVLLQTCIDALPDTIGPHELGEALVHRIAVLTDPPPRHTVGVSRSTGSADPVDTRGPVGSADVNVTAPPEAAAPVAFPPSPPADASVAVTTKPARIVDLNEQAAAFYRDQLDIRGGWARPYLAHRFGELTELLLHPDLSGLSDAGPTVGYAPRGPRALLTHLLDHGASLAELHAAGLVKQRRSGREDGTDGGDGADVEWVDVFRDRLVLPVREPDGGLVGFVGRRNPTKTDHDYAGPKYLNTRTTTVFKKSEALFGYAENQRPLTAGALPVLVEGPLDALAITLAHASSRSLGGTAEAAAVGIAPLGTALTDHQIALLTRWARPHEATSDAIADHLAIATDHDPAGWTAAQRAYWRLTAHGIDPTHLSLPEGLDPADLLHEQGPAALADAIRARIPLGDALIRARLHSPADRTQPATRLRLTRDTAAIIAARPVETWPAAIAAVNHALRLSPGILEHEVLHHSTRRDNNIDDVTSDELSRIDPPRSRAGKPTERGTAPRPSRSRALAPSPAPRDITAHRPLGGEQGNAPPR
ncbi:MobF family relaxase [Nocardioides zeae]|uniref:MobF family relaxase n=1 Tax=Nocardioides imazamoxiresistens TaxID=3231893 RepID=A0ABU3PSK8_9ACTN|nr:MobF family relaxase [Nocardioides zeae]MDT9592218.1 MobF family relaxase [Nocardioides zeae]